MKNLYNQRIVNELVLKSRYGKLERSTRKSSGKVCEEPEISSYWSVNTKKQCRLFLRSIVNQLI